MGSEPSDLQVPPPADWQAFERHMRDLFEAHWRASAQLHGRTGQPQHGVDIYGQPNGGNDYHGVQCKLHDRGKQATVTDEELRDEAKKARKFEPRIRRFILITTSDRDVYIQAVARELSDDKAAAFPVQVMFWGDVLSLYDQHLDVFGQHYPGIPVPRSEAIRQFPPPSERIPCIQMHGHVIAVYDGRVDAPMLLPCDPPTTSARFGRAASTHAKHWKRVHTLAERAYRAFRRVHLELLSDGGPGRASQSLGIAFTELERFSSEVRDMPAAVRKAEHITPILAFSRARNALRRGLASPAESPEFTCMPQVVGCICEWYLECLTRADQYLEKYFREHGGPSA